MSPRSQKQFEEIREERREQIMHVALELLATEGFAHVTIAKIADKAGISKGLLYNYFENKEHLITEITLKGLNELIKVFDPNNDRKLSSHEMHYFIDQVFEILKTNTRFWRLYFMLLFQPEVFKVIESKMMQIMEPYIISVTTFFSQKGSADPIAEMRFFGAMMDGICLNYVMDIENFPLEGIKKKLHEMYK